MSFAVGLDGRVHYLKSENLGELLIALDELKAARAAGVSAVGFGEDRIEYKSDREMATAIASIEADIARLTRGNRSRTFYPRTSKGL